jgi:hypothetical protein
MDDNKKKSGYRPEQYTEEARKDRFNRIATRRTNRILNDLRLLGNTSHRSLYYYEDRDVEKVFQAIEKKIIEVRAKFKTKDKEKPFRFED